MHVTHSRRGANAQIKSRFYSALVLPADKDDWNERSLSLILSFSSRPSLSTCLLSLLVMRRTHVTICCPAAPLLPDYLLLLIRQSGGMTRLSAACFALLLKSDAIYTSSLCFTNFSLFLIFSFCFVVLFSLSGNCKNEVRLVCTCVSVHVQVCAFLMSCIGVSEVIKIPWRNSSRWRKTQCVCVCV